MSDAEALFDALAAGFAGGPVTTGAMFGSKAFLVAGKAVACVKGDVLAVKLGAGTTAHTDAMAQPGAMLFDPSGKHRPFKDWVAIPVPDAHGAGFDGASTLLEAAVAHALA